MKRLLIALALFLLSPAAASAGSQTYAIPGSYTFSVPRYQTLTVEMWGGGGGGGTGGAGWTVGGGGGGGGYSRKTFATGEVSGSITVTVGSGGTGAPGSYNNGQPGGTSRFGSYVSASGGGGGFNTCTANGEGGAGGSGLTAYGYAGSPGQGGQGGGPGGAGGYANGSGGQPGGGGGGQWGGGRGGGCGNGGGAAGNGGPGLVRITWTDIPVVPRCSVTADRSAIATGETTTLRWSSADVTNFYIAGVGYVRPNEAGSATVGPSATTRFDGTATAQGGVTNDSRMYSTPGSHSFVVPQNSSLTVEVWGAGGGGGAGGALGTYGGGGGGGGYSTRTFTSDDLPATVTISVGAGGAGAPGSYNNGQAGGGSSFGAFVSAGGGGGGFNTCSGGGAGGAGGSGSSASGQTGTTATGGKGGGSWGGAGGVGNSGGMQPGGGGGGAQGDGRGGNCGNGAQAAGAGANGLVIVSWSTTTAAPTVSCPFTLQVGESDGSCMFNGRAVPDGGSVVAYSVPSAGADGLCPRETRTCTDGVLSGSYRYDSCDATLSCTVRFDPALITRGESSTLSWSSTSASSCSSPSFATGGRPSGSVRLTPVVGTAYGATCTGPQGTVQCATAQVSYRCIQGYSCGGPQGQTLMLTDSSCLPVVVAECAAPLYCESGSNRCIAPLITGTISALPRVAREGATIRVEWATEHAARCIVRGGEAEWWTGENGSETFTFSNTITLTLECDDFDADDVPDDFIKSVTVTNIPIFKEL